MAEPRLVLDTSALLAVLLQEPGAEMVASALDEAALSAVNLVEVTEVAIRKGFTPERARLLVDDLRLPVLPFDAETAADAARLLAAFRKDKISLGDSACIATARHHGMPVLTADRIWATLDLGIEVRLIR